jgi:hypothetical protein
MTKSFRVVTVADAVSFDLVLPEGLAGGRPFEERAIMAVPETSVGEQSGAEFRED